MVGGPPGEIFSCTEVTNAAEYSFQLKVNFVLTWGCRGSTFRFRVSVFQLTETACIYWYILQY
jgi:hypothetical protein